MAGRNHNNSLRGQHSAPPRARNQGPFVGRTQEVAQLSSMIAHVANGGSASLMVTGEAGVGKTRLLQSAFEEAGEPAHWVGCTSYASAPPFWPIVQLLRSLRLRVGAETYIEAAGPEAASLFDPLASHGHVAAMLGGVADRVQLHDRVLKLLRSLAEVEPLLLVVEDAQWADPSTIQILSMIARSTVEDPIGLFVSFRTNEANSPQAGELAQLAQSHSTVHLKRFTRGLTSEYINKVTETTPTAVTVDRAYEATGGNALFLAEYVAATESPDSGPMPASVADLIGRRVGLLSEPDLHRVRCAAVIGEVVGLDLLAELSETPTAETAASVDRLIAADILLAQDAERVMFAHGVLRESIYRDIAAPLQRELHRRAATIIDDRGAEGLGAFAAEAAQHWLLSESAQADTLALDRIEMAARTADLSYAREEAARRYEEAIEIVDGLPSDDQTRVRQIGLLLALGRAYSGCSRPDDARSVLRRAAVLAESQGRLELLAEIAVAFPPGLEGVAVAPEADLEQVELRHRALELLPATATRLRAELLGALATSQYWSTHMRGEADQFATSLSEQERLTDEALEVSAALGDPVTRARCLMSRMYAVWSPNHLHERAALVKELEQLANELGDLELLTAAVSWRVLESMEAGRMKEAMGRQAAYLELAERLSHPLHLRNARHRTACLQVLQGDLAGGVAAAVAAMEDATRLIGEENAVAELAMLLSMERFFDGDYSSLVEPARHVIASSPRTTLNWQCGLTFMLADGGEIDEARPLLEHLVGDDHTSLPRDINWLVSTQLLALSAVRVGDQARGRVLYQALLPYADLDVIHGWGYASYGPVGWALGELALADGRVEDAIAHLDEAVRTRDAGPYRAIAELELRRAQLLNQSAVDTGFELDRLASQLRSWGCDRHAAMADELARSAGRSLRQVSRLTRDGEVWHLESKRFGSATLPHERGLGYLAELLRHPGQPIDALSLVAGLGPGSGDTPGSELHSPSGLGALIDATARRSYQRRIEQLQRTRTRSERRGDLERVASCDAEISAIEQQLSRATGLGDRDRYAADEVERARTSTTKAIRRTIGRIEDVSPAFGSHLRDTIATGRQCCYGPSSTTVDWLVSTS